MSDIRVSMVSFSEEGIGFQYQASDDVRSGGMELAHQLSASASNPDYADDFEELHIMAQRLLVSLLEDFRDAEPYSLVDLEDDDDGIEGMGMEPGE